LAIIGLDDDGWQAAGCDQYVAAFSWNTIPRELKPVLETPGTGWIFFLQLNGFKHDGVVNQNKPVFPAGNGGCLARQFLAFEQTPPADRCETGYKQDH